jgi:hypothetical protein
MIERTTRRTFLVAGGALLGGAIVPRPFWASEELGKSDVEIAAGKSPLIYVSPLRSDGSESRCHGEVWFVAEGRDLLVVCAADRWRARAIEGGLGFARIWVGDHGVWTTSDGAFRKSPNIVMEGAFEKDSARHASALAAFGVKYSSQWSSWGPRFSKGLADGSRVLIRYRLTTASISASAV